MNAVRIPTPAQNDAMVRANRAHVYAEVQSMRPDVAAAGMACCDAANDERDEVLSEDFVIGCLGVAFLVVLAIFFTWGLPA